MLRKILLAFIFASLVATQGAFLPTHALAATTCNKKGACTSVTEISKKQQSKRRSGGNGSGGPEAPGPVCVPQYGCHGTDWLWLGEAQVQADDPGCVVAGMYICVARGPAATPRPAPTRADVAAWASVVVNRLQVPTPTIHLGPEPSVNEWNMAVVGHPVWFWTSERATASSSLDAFGFTFRLTAHRQSVTFTFGDGTTKTCAHMTPYPGGESVIGTPSPTCGHTYTTPSLPKGSYTVTANARWVVDWEAAGFTGSIPLTLQDSRSVRVGELQSVTVKDRSGT